jgi:hypothetical protein
MFIYNSLSDLTFPGPLSLIANELFQVLID